MICPYCGHKHPDEAKFCPTTGRKLGVASFCMHCGASIQPGWTFCSVCGLSTGSVPVLETTRSSAQYIYPGAPMKIRSWAAWSVITILAIALIFLLIDPFQLGLIGRLSGNYDAAANVMPAGTDLYIGINLINARPTQLERLAPLGLPFMDIFGDELQSSLQEATGEGDMLSTDTLAQIDEAIQNDFGITLSQDVTPWIGQYLGFGLVETGGQSEPRLVLAVEARSSRGADTFLEKLANGVAEKQNAQFDQVEYNGVKIYTQRNSRQADQMVFGRSGRMVLFATGLEALQQAIDAQNNTSLADDSTFRELLQNLPRQNIVKLYLPDEWFAQTFSSYISGSNDPYTSLALSILVPTMMIPAWNGSMMSVSMVEAGLQIDIFNEFDTQQLSEIERQTLEGGISEYRLMSKIPSNSLVYITGERLNEKWDYFVNTAATQTNVSTNDYLNTLEHELGFDPSLLFTFLKGEWALCVVPTTTGHFVIDNNLNLGYFFIAEVEESEFWLKLLRSFTEEQQTVSYWNVERFDLDNGIIYETYNFGENQPIVAYGINQGYFVVGPSQKLIDEIFNSRQLLYETIDFSQVQAYLPEGTSPTFYMNVLEFWRVIRQGFPYEEQTPTDESTKFLESIGWIAAAHTPLKDNITRGVLLINLPEK